MAYLAPIEQSCRHCGIGTRADGTAVAAVIAVCPGHEFQVHPQAATPVLPSSPPPYRQAVFVLFTFDENGVVKGLGTAFAVECDSHRLMLTAGHCVSKMGDDNIKVYVEQLFCCRELLLDEARNQYAPQDPFEVKVLRANYSSAADIAILQTMDKVLETRIPLCPHARLPWVVDPATLAARACILHCPLGHCEDAYEDVSVELTNFLQVAKVARHHFKLAQCDLGPGSSGGPVLLERENCLIGIFGAVNEVKTTLEGVKMFKGAEGEGGSITGSERIVSPRYGYCVIPTALTVRTGSGLLDFERFLRVVDIMANSK